jgi:hypothetical protein
VGRRLCLCVVNTMGVLVYVGVWGVRYYHCRTSYAKRGACASPVAPKQLVVEEQAHLGYAEVGRDGHCAQEICLPIIPLRYTQPMRGIAINTTQVALAAEQSMGWPSSAHHSPGTPWRFETP